MTESDIRETIGPFQDEWAFLSNFYRCEPPFGYSLPSGRIVRAKTSEHAYQACKAGILAEQDAILAKSTPGQAKRAGNRVNLASNWHKLKLYWMYNLLIVKFSEPNLRKKLLNTGNARLVEKNNWNDYYWGECNGVGENYLGYSLEFVRVHYLANTDGILAILAEKERNASIIR